jgi:thiamine transporter ThiT
VLWVAGVGARIAFSQFAEHGGGASIYRFSAAHSITSMQAWVAALILMSFAEVMARLVTMWLRARRLPQPVVATRRELVTV